MSGFTVYEDGATPESRIYDFVQAATNVPGDKGLLITGRVVRALITDEGFALMLAARESELVYRGYRIWAEERVQ